MRYMVVVERGETSWGAHVPDLPGCVAIGETREEALEQDGLPIPGPSSDVAFVEVGAE